MLTILHCAEGLGMVGAEARNQLLSVGEFAVELAEARALTLEVSRWGHPSERCSA